MEYVDYDGHRIPICTGKSARAFYNMPQDEIDRLKCGTEFDEDGDCTQGFGTPFEEAFGYVDEQECKERAEYLMRNQASILHLFEEHNVPCKYQNGLPYCLLADAMVRMADGTVKPIKDVRTFDVVWTAEGNASTVKQLHGREYEGDLVTVKLWGHSHLRLTPNHEVLTKRGYVPSGELRGDDYVRLPRVSSAVRVRVLQTAQLVAPVKQYSGAGRGCDTWNNHAVKELPDFIELDRDFGYLIGLYAAEGFRHKNVATWAFDIKERETIAAEASRIIREKFSETTGKQANGSNGILVELYGKQWASLFEALCGKLAHGKKLHPDVMSGPDEFLHGVWDGWIAGDGHHRVRDTTVCDVGATVSKQLAHNMFDIANYLGLRPSILKEKPQKNEYAKTRKPVWKVSAASKSDNWRVHQDAGATWRKVRSIETEHYRGRVYNIGVEGDNSYIADGLGVHNCWGYGACSALEAALLVAGRPYVQLSPESVCAPVTGGRSRGGWAKEWLEYALKHGVAKQSTWKPHDRNYRSYDTPEIREERKEAMPLEVVHIRSGDMHALLSASVTNQASGIGLMWWGHLIMFGLPYFHDKYGWLYGERNSHGSRFGYKGWLFHTEASARHGGGSIVRVAA